MRSIICFLFLFIVSCNGLKTLTTSYGALRGITEYSTDGNQKHIFKSVPFALPPLGSLRFELPQPPRPWKGVRDASTYSAACMTSSHKTLSPQNRVSEDCLYVNIFTSDACLKSKCPVIIYYHGGAFNIDSATMFPDKFILERYVAQGIVFAIPAFRIGVFGLFNLGNTTFVKDNIALYDAQASLNYLHNEISNFGGDPTRVTLMGHSSGGSLVEMFGFSRKIDPERKLFQKMIVLSAPSTFSERDLLVQNSFEFSKRAGCYNPNEPNINLNDILVCLRKMSGRELLQIQADMEQDDLNFRNFLKSEPFMDSDEKIADLKRNTISRNMLIGCSEYEFGKVVHQNPALSGSFMDFDNQVEVDREFRRLKVDHDELANSDSAAVFVSAATYSEAMANAGGTVYLFESRQGPNSNHVSDMQYFIGIHREIYHTKDQDILDSFYSKMLVNFTKFDNPTPNWQPLDPAKMNYYALEVDTRKNIGPQMAENFHEDDVNLWMINLTAFDREVTRKKNGGKASEESITTTISHIDINNSTALLISDNSTGATLIYPEQVVTAVSENELQEDSSSIFGQWWFYLIIVLVIFVLICVFYTFRKSLQEERRPLLIG